MKLIWWIAGRYIAQQVAAEQRDTGTRRVRDMFSEINLPPLQTAAPPPAQSKLKEPGLQFLDGAKIVRLCCARHCPLLTTYFRPLMLAEPHIHLTTSELLTWSASTSARIGARHAAHSRRSLQSCTRTLQRPAKSSESFSSAETGTRSRFESE
jgi:hypothetical protein